MITITVPCYFYNDRPCAIAREYRANPTGRGYHSVYAIAYLDGQVPAAEDIPAGQFNARALCGCCRKRINLMGKRGCDCDFVSGVITDEDGNRISNPANGQCPKHHHGGGST